jgi:hypothetical protein
MQPSISFTVPKLLARSNTFSLRKLKTKIMLLSWIIALQLQAYDIITIFYESNKCSKLRIMLLKYFSSHTSAICSRQQVINQHYKEILYVCY